MIPFVVAFFVVIAFIAAMVTLGLTVASRIRMFAVAAVFLLAALPGVAQQTTVAATAITADAFGNLLASGSFCAIVVNDSNIPIGYELGGGGNVAQSTAKCVPITSGAIPSGTKLPDVSLTSPSYPCIRITIQDQYGNVVRTDPCAQPTGSTWSYDTFTPGGAELPLSLDYLASLNGISNAGAATIVGGTGISVGTSGTAVTVNATGIFSGSSSDALVYATNTGSGVGVAGSGTAAGVAGTSTSTGPGVAGTSTSTGPGVAGTSTGSAGIGVSGIVAGTGSGVFGTNSGTGPGVYGTNTGAGPAGKFVNSGTGPGVIAIGEAEADVVCFALGCELPDGSLLAGSLDGGADDYQTVLVGFNGASHGVLTKGTGVTSITCVGSSSSCLLNFGTMTLVGGTATTGTIATLAWSMYGSEAAPSWCNITEQGSTTDHGLRFISGSPGTITAANSVAGATIVFNYDCRIAAQG